MQEIWISPYEQMVYAQQSNCPGEWQTQTPMGLWHTNASPILGQKTRLYSNQQQKRELTKLPILLYRLITEKSWKNVKRTISASESKKQWNLKVTIGTFGTVTKGLFKGLDDLEFGGRVETIQTTKLLRTARILRRVLEIWGDMLSLKLQ